MKRPRDCNGIELRIRANHDKEPSASHALTELERRRGNLRGAVIPPWEIERRGPTWREWAVL